MAKDVDDDILLVYIGSAPRSLAYAEAHFIEPKPKPAQILAVQKVSGLYDDHGVPLQLPPWCHIATELHTTKFPPRTYEALGADVPIIYASALACRRTIPKAGV